MACLTIFDVPVSDDVIAKVRSRLDVTSITVGRMHPSRVPEVVAWLRSDEAQGSYVLGTDDWIFTDMGTAFAFKMRFG